MDSRFYQEQYYTQGNTARKLNTAPEIIERPEQRQRKEHQVNKHTKKNAARAKAFDFKYTFMLTVATVFLFGSCFRMLSIEAEISEQRREIAMLESNLNELTDNNNEASKRIESSVNLPEVYQIATTELGMVYPKSGQVLSYEASNPDYVKQFKDVPVD